MLSWRVPSGPPISPLLNPSASWVAIPLAHALTLSQIAERAAPGEIVQVIGAASPRQRCYSAQLGGNVAGPERCGHDMIDMELADRLLQTVLARIAGTQTSHLTHQLIVRIVAR